MTEGGYSIGDLAREFGVTTRTIRFYEERGFLAPRREGTRRIYSPGDRVRVRLILRGKRLGMTLDECMEIIDLYDPQHGNAAQLNSLLERIDARRALLLAQRHDIEAMLGNLDEVETLCRRSLDGLREGRKRPAPRLAGKRNRSRETDT